MVSSSKLESLADRFGPYIDELREFFTSRRVPFGSPDRLDPFLDRLDGDPPFADEMGSMVRSILYREERLPRTELMEVVAVAVGGLHVEDAAQDLHHVMRRLLSFVANAARPSQAGLAPEEFPASDPVVLPEPQAVADADAPNSPALPPWQLDHAVSTPDPLRPDTNGRLAQTLAASATLPGTPADEAAAHSASPARTGPLAPVTDKRSRRSFAAILQHSYWIPGVAVLVVAVLLGLYLTSDRKAPSTIALPAASPTLPGIPKPSPYVASNGGRASDFHPADGVALPQPARDRHQFDSFTQNRPQPAGDRRPGLLPTVRPARPAPAPMLLNHNGLSPGEGVFLASSGAMASHLVSAPAPEYPKLANFARVEGQVILQVVVSRNGGVAATRVLDGPRLLRGAAEHAVRRWRYRPYTVDGRPTDVATIVTVSFRLRH